MGPKLHKGVANRKATDIMGILCYTFLLKSVVLEIVMILQEILEPVVHSQGFFIVLSVMIFCPQFSFCEFVLLRFVSVNI